MDDKKRKNRIFWLLFLIFGGFIFKLLGFLFKNKKQIKHNLDDFFKDEMKEVNELAGGEEDFNTYCRDSWCIFKDYFIPNQANDHKPKILRVKSLAIIAVLLVFIKLSITGYLFFLYPNQAVMNNVIISRVYTLINIDRQENNLPPLALNSILNNSAQAKANDMAENDYFAHESLDGKKPWDWINRAEYPYLFVGENLAMNFTSADAVHKALMLSPTHKKNILNDKFNEVGLAMTKGVIDGKETNLLVQLFAYRKIEIVPLLMEIDQKDESLEPKIQTPEAIEALEVASEKIEPEKDSNELETIIEEEISQESQKAEIPPVSAPISQEEPSQNDEKISDELSGESELVGQMPPEDEFIFEEMMVEPEEAETNQSETVEFDLENENETAALLNTENFDAGLNTELKYYDTQFDSKFELVVFLVKVSKYIYLAVLVFIVAALLFNIFIRVRIQHKSVILQSVLLIIFIIGLISVHLHILESIVSGVAII